MRGFSLMVVILFMATVVFGVQVRELDLAWHAPADVDSRVNPLAGRSDVVPGGLKIYEQRCATCHRDNGRGSPKAPDLTQPRVQQQRDGELFWKISSGNTRGGMPSFSFLPEPQRWQLVLAVRSMAAGRR